MMRWLVFAAAGLATVMTAYPDALRMNHIQVIGTHNSYHLAPGPLAARVADWAAGAKGLDYSHPPLNVQLDQGVRSFELDLNHTPEGFAIFHVPVIDTRSTCPWFAGCLETVRAWSDAHREHVPISFLLELKDGSIRYDNRLLEFDAESLDRLDAEILNAFPRERLITPDDVRGKATTLEEAVLAQGWPALADVRGKVFFILHERGKNRDLYTRDRPALEGRVMFVNSRPGRPDAATLVLDHPDASRISPLVKKGYLIRTRADAGLRTDEKRRDAALATGAHILSTDFPPGGPHASGYAVRFSSGAARCNPVNAPAHCAGAALDPVPVSIAEAPSTGTQPDQGS